MFGVPSTKKLAEIYNGGGGGAFHHNTIGRPLSPLNSPIISFLGYKGKGLTTHIDVLSYGKTCRAKGLPSLPEYRSESMVQLIPGTI